MAVGAAIAGGLASGAASAALSSGGDAPGLRQLTAGGPNTLNTRRSELDLQKGRIVLDPRFRKQQDRSLDRFRGLADRLGENRNAFLEARVAPLERQIGQRRSGLREELSRTGVRGTFRNQALNRFDLEAEQRLGEERAKAEQQSIEAERAIAQDIANIGSEAWQREMEELGLSGDIVSRLMSRAVSAQSNDVRAMGLRNRRQMNIFDRYSSAIGGIHSSYQNSQNSQVPRSDPSAPS